MCLTGNAVADFDYKINNYAFGMYRIDGLVHKRRNFSASTMELVFLAPIHRNEVHPT